MRRKRFRRELSDNEITLFAKFGERVGRSLRLNAFIPQANAYLRKHRRKAMPLIVLGMVALFVLGLWLDSRKGVRMPNIPDELIMPIDTFRNYDKQIIEQHYELNEIIDSVQFLIDRGNLSTEDSLYIAWGITYLNNINEHQK